MVITSIKIFYKLWTTANDVASVLLPDLTAEWSLSLSVKRKPESCAPSKQRETMLSSSTASTNLSSSTNPSVDVLKHMIHEVEHEMEDYERSTGREVKEPQNSQGLTGFTLSLVSSLCRLVRYLKEVSEHLRWVGSPLQSAGGLLSLHLIVCNFQIKYSHIWIALFTMPQF